MFQHCRHHEIFISFSHRCTLLIALLFDTFNHMYYQDWWGKVYLKRPKLDSVSFLSVFVVDINMISPQ